MMLAKAEIIKRNMMKNSLTSVIVNFSSLQKKAVVSKILIQVNNLYHMRAIAIEAIRI